MRRPVIGLASFAAAALALAGCGTGGTVASSTASAPVSTAIPDTPVTLTIAYASDPPITPLTQGFTALHPNVTFKLVQTPFADYQTSLKLSLSGDEAPDIVQYSPGPMRAIVPAGLVQSLEPYAAQYGWKDKVSPSLLGMLSSNKDATQYGTGDLYAVPGAIQLIGVFYNKKLTTAAGVRAEPATLADFEKDLAAVKRAGTVPLSLPALGVGGFQLWGALANVMADPAVFNAWVQGKPGTTLESDPGFAAAAGKVREWSAAGYFPTGAAAIADADGIKAFTSGKAAYYVTGNWNAKAFRDALGDDVGFFLMPGTSPGPAVATGSGFPYSISAKSKHKDVAAAFLNYMVSAQAAKPVYDSGFVPVTPDGSAGSSDVRGTIQSAYQSVVKGKGIAPFANWASSSMIDTLTKGAQGLISGSLTPQAYIASLQADWAKNRR